MQPDHERGFEITWRSLRRPRHFFMPAARLPASVRCCSKRGRCKGCSCKQALANSPQRRQRRRAALQQFRQQHAKCAHLDPCSTAAIAASGANSEAAPKSPSRQPPVRMVQNIVGIQVAMQDAMRVQLAGGRGNAVGDGQQLRHAEAYRFAIHIARARGQAGRPGQVEHRPRRSAASPVPAILAGEHLPYRGWESCWHALPALTQAAISLRGKPSLVMAPLKTLTATGLPSSVACEITPEAPSPSCRPSCKRSQSICSMPAASSAAASRVSLNGLPAQASQLRRGKSCSQAGSDGRRLAEIRSNSSRLQRASESGKRCKRLPASISFCNCAQSPSLFRQHSRWRCRSRSASATWAAATRPAPRGSVGLEADHAQFRTATQHCRQGRKQIV